MLGRRVVVYGGGNTAIDVARTAKRLGATEAVIVYRRTRERMPALDFEVEEALEEGVLVKWLSTIKQAGDGELTIEKMVLDEKGNPQPTGELETLQADSLVLALGQDVDLSLLDGVPGLILRDGVVDVDPATMMTGHPGLFAGGDMVPADRNVTVAIGHGKKAARHIDAWLRGTRIVAAPKHAPATFERLNTWYYSDAPKTMRPQLDMARRTSSFGRGPGRPHRRKRALRGAPLPQLRQLLRVRQLLRRLPRQCRPQARPRQGLRVQVRLLQGLRLSASPSVPSGAIEMVPEDVLARSRRPVAVGLTQSRRLEVLQADRIGDLDVTLANEEEPAGLELRERATDRLELDSQIAADFLPAHPQHDRGRREPRARSRSSGSAGRPQPAPRRACCPGAASRCGR
jgi:hypothetical protein